MKAFTLVMMCLLALVAYVHAQTDAEINAAIKKFCGGLRVTEPRTGQKVKEGQEVSIVVDRVVNNLGKRIIAVELYEITNAAKKEAKLIEQVGGNHNIRLNHSATLKDKFNVPKGTKLPGTFTYRVWVENDAGPDCTLLSGSFTATK